MKKTLQQKVAMRKYARPNPIIWWVLTHLVAPIVMKQYGKQTLTIKDDIDKYPGAKFLVYNHQSRFDWVNIVKLTRNKRINFVVGYNEFFRSHFKLIFKLVRNIPKKNFTTDLVSIKAMSKIIKDGGIVCFSPEGMSSITGHSQPIVPNTGKFLKHFGVPVYAMKSQGAYLVNHKVCLDNRPGMMEAELVCLISPEQIKEMSPEEIDAKINEYLWQDDYDWNFEKKYHFKNMENATSHFEDLAYHCPKCGKEFGIVTNGNEIHCELCGNGATLDDQYVFHPYENSVMPVSLSKWVDYERHVEYQRIKNDPNYEFVVEDVVLGELLKYKYLTKKRTSMPCGKGKIICNHKGFFFEGERDGKPFNFMLHYKEFWTLVIVTDCTFTGVYVNGEYLDLIPPKPVIGKLLLMVEEFSRFHYNVWPNFPWLDYIYKDEVEKEKYFFTK